jgi:hypothetical protein
MFADINEKDAQNSAMESKKYASNPEYRAVAIHVDVTFGGFSAGDAL